MSIKYRIFKFMIDWISSFLDMICGLISFVTFTLYRPWWDFTFRAQATLWLIKYTKNT